ncbi:hypothetical protein BRD02_03005 [Halobacteriales archaeon QS_8_69_73]|nr:MAG: hypothetical protein BRD02_03005 [Halobacteriales archaeon QS_8_69_73]
MRDGVAAVVFVVALVGSVAGFGAVTSQLSADSTPDADFAVSSLDDGRVVVEHVGGEPLEATVRIIVYEERRFLPDRTVHASGWNGTVRPGKRLRLEDQRFEPGQRLVIRWYGGDGQANLASARL